MKQYPVRNAIYTYPQMLKLELDDNPCLCFIKDGLTCVIQDSHVTNDELLSVPGFKDLQWRYEYTTAEWIPVFKAVDAKAVIDCVDIKFTDENEDCYWVTPKGFPREFTL